MDEDIQSQLERAKELLQELEKACDNDLQAKNVSGKTKNLSQEVLLKVRHLLDQAIYKFFEKHYLSSLYALEKMQLKKAFLHFLFFHLYLEYPYKTLKIGLL